jgi:hypothetical protein
VGAQGARHRCGIGLFSQVKSKWVFANELPIEVNMAKENLEQVIGARWDRCLSRTVVYSGEKQSFLALSRSASRVGRMGFGVERLIRVFSFAIVLTHLQAWALASAPCSPLCSFAVSYLYE